MLHNPIISIVTPVYGVEKYIDKFLDSISQQNNLMFELILVDDGSKDKCPQIIDDYAKENSNCIVIHQENQGVSIARNNGIELARGEYIYIADSDDWLESDAIDSFIDGITRTKADVIFFDFCKEYDDEKKKEKIEIFKNEFIKDDRKSIQELQKTIFYNFPIELNNNSFGKMFIGGGAPWRILIKRELIVANNLKFDSYVKGLADDVLFSLYLFEYVNTVAYIKKMVYHYRIVNNSLSHGFKRDLIDRYNLVFEKFDEFLENKDEEYIKASYCRVLYYLFQSMRFYFLSSHNKNSKNSRYNEFLWLINTHPYKEAIQGCNVKIFRNYKMRIKAVLLKNKMNGLFWLVHCLLRK